jgi:hypothetical protein
MKFKSSAIDSSMEGMSREAAKEHDGGDLIGFLSASTDAAVRASQRISGALAKSGMIQTFLSPSLRRSSKSYRD